MRVRQEGNWCETVDEAAEKVKDFAEKAVDAVADAAEKVKETIEEKIHKDE